MGAVAAVFQHLEGDPGVFLLDAFTDQQRHEAIVMAPDHQHWWGV